MAKKHIDINDLKDSAAAELTEDDLNKVTGGIAIIANQSTIGNKQEPYLKFSWSLGNVANKQDYFR